MALSGAETTTYLQALKEGCPPDFRYFSSSGSRVADIKAAQTAADSTTWPGKAQHGTVKF